ncbi:MAG: DNA (cytosine-5-)-methyltransferase [Oscillospiraceae bacterium]|nr:DNA (cytosine-5-)-methyltransferase [Oscillospiraceae bacterium]MCL2278598.1 DNA (cytosine-5-)-methyltransferase [Oscillospiraceae bacterium]
MRVGSMFAGIGGICLGFKYAGASIVWANEQDKFACKTYRHVFGQDYLVEGDIRKIELDSIPDFDVLTAGFPCQPFSIMGKQKGFADPRGTMYFEILRVIDFKKPGVVLLENVKNLIKHDNGNTFATICKTLIDRGYFIKYSVPGPDTHANTPQYRDRLFIVAFASEKMAEQFSFPEKMPLERSVNDIIDRSAPVDEKYYYKKDNPYYDSLNSRMIDNNAIYRIDDSGVAMMAWHICPTLKANMGTYHDRVPLIRDSFGIRKLTPEDCLALQGFPKGFNFPNVPQNEIYKQLGNTVCVPVVVRIAREIRRVFNFYDT